MSIIIAIIIFSVLVLFHEFGHFLFAKLSHIEVLEFALGMGPTLIGFEKGGTKYSIKCLPIGGLCAMKGEDGEDVSPGSFNGAPILGRILTVFAGPAFNFILAFVFAVIVVLISGYDEPIVTAVEEGSPAMEAGLREGDRICEMDGHTIDLARDIYTINVLIGMDEEQMDLTVVRDGKKEQISYVPAAKERYMLGFSYTRGSEASEIASVTLDGAMHAAGIVPGDRILEFNGTVINSGDDIDAYFQEHPMDGSVIHIKYLSGSKIREADLTPDVKNEVSTGFSYNMGYRKGGLFTAVRFGFLEVKYWIRTTLFSLKMLVTGKLSMNDMSGPVGIVTTIGDTYNSAKSFGWLVALSSMLEMAILLSANLGVMNLLPLPALDGGRLVFLILEAVRRKPVNRNVEGFIHFIGLALLMLLVLFITAHDVIKLF